MLLVLIYFFLLIWSNSCDLCELITATTFFAFTWSIKLLFLSISLLTIWGQAFIPPISQKHGPLKCSTYNMRKLFFISSSMFALNHSHPCGLNVDICIDKLLSHNKKPPKSHIFLNLHFWISVKVTMMYAPLYITANILFWWDTLAVRLSQTSLNTLLHILTVYIRSSLIGNDNSNRTCHPISYAMQPLSV